MTRALLEAKAWIQDEGERIGYPCSLIDTIDAALGGGSVGQPPVLTTETVREAIRRGLDRAHYRDCISITDAETDIMHELEGSEPKC